MTLIHLRSRTMTSNIKVNLKCFMLCIWLTSVYFIAYLFPNDLVRELEKAKQSVNQFMKQPIVTPMANPIKMDSKSIIGASRINAPSNSITIKNELIDVNKQQIQPSSTTATTTTTIAPGLTNSVLVLTKPPITSFPPPLPLHVSHPKHFKTIINITSSKNTQLTTTSTSASSALNAAIANTAAAANIHLIQNNQPSSEQK